MKENNSILGVAGRARRSEDVSKLRRDELHESPIVRKSPKKSGTRVTRPSELKVLRRSHSVRADADPTPGTRCARSDALCLAAVVLLVALAQHECVAANLRNVTLQIAWTNQGATEIIWQSKSVVPLPGFRLFPDYQLDKSDDLATWSALGAKLIGSTNSQAQTMRAFDAGTNGGRAFYRVQSIIDRPYADFNQARLGSAELAHANFFGAQFFAAILTNADLTGADLRGADLRFADLTGANLTNADLFAADLVLARLNSANLEHADVSFASLEGADLIESSLLGANLRSTILTDADLRFAVLHKSLIDMNTLLDPKWRRVWQIVNGQTITKVFTNADLSFADLREADLRDANLSRADLTTSALGGADLRGANLTQANLRFAGLRGTLFDTNTIIEAKSRLVWEILIQGAVGRDLHGTNLSSTFLANADLRSVNLTNANLNLAILFEANLSDANLQNANLSGVDFTDAILTNAILNSVNLNSADLTRANLFGATTNGATFFGATFSQTVMPDGSIRSP